MREEGNLSKSRLNFLGIDLDKIKTDYAKNEGL